MQNQDAGMPLRAEYRGLPAVPVNQVVTGLIPHEPPNFQTPAQVATLKSMPGEVCVVCTVTGQRGVGKTQIAASYARQRVRDGWLVAWISAETEDQIKAGIVELADRLELYRLTDSVEVTAARVRNHLQTRSGPALLVFDNAVSLDSIKPFLPSAGTTQVVITSTLRGSQLGHEVLVDVFDEPTALRFLREATGVHDGEGAVELARKLGHLPLALAQAAARIKVGRNYASYLERLRSVPIGSLLKRRDGDPYPTSAAQAILLAIEPFEHSELVEALAVLSPDGVSLDFLGSECEEELQLLHEASVVHLAGSSSVVMHRLTQRVIRENCRDLTDILLQAANRIIELMPHHDDLWRDRHLCNELVRQIEALWEHSTAGSAEMLLTLQRWAVNYLVATASYARATPLAELCYDSSRTHLKANAAETVQAGIMLASAHLGAMRPEESVLLLEQLWVICQEHHGRHSELGQITVMLLARAYWSSDRKEDAGRLYIDVLISADRDSVELIPELFAAACQVAGDNDATVKTIEDKVANLRKTLGDADPATLMASGELSSVYSKTGRITEAVEISESAASLFREAHGEDHPDLLAAMSDLAGLYVLTDRLDDAAVTYEHTLASQRRVLGGDHPATLLSIGCLADVHRRSGRTAQAIPLLTEGLEAARRTLGEESTLFRRIELDLRECVNETP